MSICEKPLSYKQKTLNDIDSLIERAKYINDMHRAINNEIINVTNEEKDIKLMEVYNKTKEKEIQTIIDMLDSKEYNDISSTLEFYTTLFEANGNFMNEQIEKLKRKAFTLSLKNYIIDQIKEANTEQKEMKQNGRVLSYSTRKKKKNNYNNVFQRIDAEIKSSNSTRNNMRNNYLIKRNKIDNSKYMSFANNNEKSNNKLSLSLPSFSKPKIKCKNKVVNTSDSVDNNRKNKMKEYNDKIYQINMSNIKLKSKSKEKDSESSNNRGVSTLSISTISSKPNLSIETISINYIMEGKKKNNKDIIYNKKIIQSKKIFKTRSKTIAIMARRSKSKSKEKIKLIDKSFEIKKEEKTNVSNDSHISNIKPVKKTNTKDIKKMNEKAQRLIKELEERNKARKEIEKQKGIINKNPKYNNIRSKLYDPPKKVTIDNNIKKRKEKSKSKTLNKSNSCINITNTTNKITIENEKSLTDSTNQINPSIENEPIIQKVDSFVNSIDNKDSIEDIKEESIDTKQRKSSRDKIQPIKEESKSPPHQSIELKEEIISTSKKDEDSPNKSKEEIILPPIKEEDKNDDNEVKQDESINITVDQEESRYQKRRRRKFKMKQERARSREASMLMESLRDDSILQK